ncbi:uncharacterized protein LOC119782061 [Lates japonicus]
MLCLKTLSSVSLIKHKCALLLLKNSLLALKCLWYGSCTEADRARLQRTLKAAQKIVGCPLPSLTDIYTTRCLSRAQNIIKDSSHPGSQLFDLLPSGRRYRCIKARTNRLKNSFFPRAVTTLNSHTQRPPPST